MKVPIPKNERKNVRITDLDRLIGTLEQNTKIFFIRLPSSEVLGSTENY